MKKLFLNILKILLYFVGIFLIIGSISIIFEGGKLLPGIISILFCFLLFPIFYVKIKDLLVLKFNLKSKIKFILIYIFTFLFGYSISITIANYDITKKQLYQEKITKLEVIYDINDKVTINDKINISIHQENLKDLQINGIKLNTNQNDIKYSLTLNLGINNIDIIGLNGKINKEFHYKITRISQEEQKKLTDELNKKNDEIKAKTQESEKLKKEQAKKEKSELDKKIKSQFSVWDGSHIGLTKFVKSNLKDPDSYEHIDTTYTVIDNGLVVFMKYRAKNSYGGYVIETIKAYYDLDGNPVNIEKWVQG